MYTWMRVGVYVNTSQDLWLLTMSVPSSCFMTLNLSFLYREPSSFPLKVRSWPSDLGTPPPTHTHAHVHFSISVGKEGRGS